MAFKRLAAQIPLWWYADESRVPLWFKGLLPLSWLFGFLARARRFLYSVGLLKSHKLPVPVVIVGNITVGGSGKTPFVVWLVQQLQAQGWRPGVISRGYGRAVNSVCEVTIDSEASLVGDEPLLLAMRTGVPVFVGRNRYQAGCALLDKYPDCDVIVSDDGLQHYALARDAEVVLFGSRGVGNNRYLPVGPLRESLARCQHVDALVFNSGELLPAPPLVSVPSYSMQLVGDTFVNCADSRQSCDYSHFSHAKVYAVAGIGDPQRFFDQLASLDITFEAHPFPDHHRYTKADLQFAKDGSLLMTEKDGVKCRSLVLRDAWMLPVEAKIAPLSGRRRLIDIIVEKINGRASA